MPLRILLSILFCCGCSKAFEPVILELPDSKILLKVPAGWVIKNVNGESGIYPQDQPAKGLQNRLHFTRLRENAETLEAAIESEINGIAERFPGSSGDRSHYKGSSPVKTSSGIQGLRADFHTESTNESGIIRHYLIVKYYFYDESGQIFKVCAHIYGDEARFRMFNEFIVNNLTVKKIE